MSVRDVLFFVCSLVTTAASPHTSREILGVMICQITLSNAWNMDRQCYAMQVLENQWCVLNGTFELNPPVMIRGTGSLSVQSLCACTTFNQHLSSIATVIVACSQIGLVITNRYWDFKEMVSRQPYWSTGGFTFLHMNSPPTLLHHT